MARKFATDGIGVTFDQARILQICLLVAHLTLLLGALRDRAENGSGEQMLALAGSLGGAIPGASALALITGILLALLTIAIGAGRPLGQDEQRLPGALTGRLAPDVPKLGSMSADDGLVARLNHDFRTPLNAIIGFAELMRTEAFGPLGNDRYKAYVGHMERCGHDLLRATECTLAMAALMSRPASRQDGAVCLARIVAQVWSQVAARSAYAGLVAIDIDDEIAIRCDRDVTRPSLTELLHVAADRAGSSGTIRVEARAAHGCVNLVIRVGGGCGIPAPRAGCGNSPARAVEELSIASARTLLGLQGITMIEAQNLPGTWQCSLSFEDSIQRELFSTTQTAATATYGFGLAASPSRSG